MTLTAKEAAAAGFLSALTVSPDSGIVSSSMLSMVPGGLVVLLLHMDGTNASTTFTDSSVSAKTGTAFGNAQLSTSRQKFGTAAGEFDGAGDYVQFANSSDFNFGSGDFTVEGWFQTDTTTGFHALIGYANGSAQNSNYEFQFLINGTSLNFSVFNGNTQYNATKSGVVSGTTHHWACVRSGTQLTAYLDGVAGTPVTIPAGTALNNPSGAVLQIGQVQGALPWDGMIDDLRITKGGALTITVPVAAYPNP